MIYLALGCAVLAALLWASSRQPMFKRREWRFLSSALAIAAFAGAAYVGIRGEWGRAIVLGVIGLWLAASTRTAAAPARVGKPASKALGDAEARSILGVAANATPADIQAAYARLMRVAHPDAGGTDGLAAQLNAARDRLLKR
ncbi:molecular chaperone DnaJ [Phenylobacterium aquaticum]|uniref:molecular chaperone DnaJ n=1 Tax=Phenylobacterium aquaticum TaxID=1763816 RepID=UPI0026F06D34|nr:molecular chaperone DnaJ [Phenylobacterium aquaticum]